MALVLGIVGCGDRVPFKKKEPLKDAALVYVYVPESVTSGEDTNTYEYSIRINNKRYMQRVTEGEYLAFDLKPVTIDISATRSQVEEHKLNVTLQSGKIYYFRILKQDDGSFTFDMVDTDKALKEIAKTGLAGSVLEDKESIISEIISPKEDKKEDVIVKQQPTKAQPQTITAVPVATPQNTTTAPTQSSSKRVTASKLDEIKEAYQMKKDGVISDEEFKTLKTQILAK